MRLEKLQYKISSRATILLGRESISRIESAVTEIVKNTYDADATMCFLAFDLPNDCIYVLDNGIGMTRAAIESNWMLIGTDNKKHEYRSEKGRVRAGEKGIGRFALDRLGSGCEMYTITANSEAVIHWTTNWDLFEESGMLLDDMYATIEELPTDLLSCLPKTVSDKVTEFLQHHNKNSAFVSGTCFVIRNLRDRWDSAELRDLEKSLEVLLPPANAGDFTIAIQDTPDSGFRIINDDITEEYDYKIQAKCDGREIKIRLFRNEFDYERIPKEAWKEEGFSYEPYRYEDFEKGYFERSISLYKLANALTDSAKTTLDAIGPFEFEYVFMKLTMPKESKEILYAKEISKNRRAWMQLHSGIKIYRDGFWVRPYGDPNGIADWLGLDARRAQNPTSVAHESETWNVRNAQGYGVVQISRVHNPLIVDVSSREGLVYNDTFKLFCKLIVSIISYFEKDRAHIAHALKAYSDKVNEAERIKERGLEIAKKLLRDEISKSTSPKEHSEQTTSTDNNTTEESKILAQAVHYYQEERKELVSEIALLRALATSGLITASIVHDLKSLMANLGIRVDKLRTSIARADTAMVERRLSVMKNDDEFMKGWISVVATQSRPDKRRRKKHDLCELISDTANLLTPILEKKEINIEVHSNKPFEKRVFPIDITSIVFNLVINSIESFSHSNVSERRIKIDLFVDREFVFTYSDNGTGISEMFEDPSDIFRYGTTSKLDIDGEAEGTGMGMYIVYTTLREYNSKPIITKHKNGFELQFKMQKGGNVMACFRVGILDDDNSKIVEIVDNLKYAFESIPEYGGYAFEPIEISIYSDIKETVAAIIDQHIECMLIDYNLSSRKTAGYNGVEVARRVWSFRKNLPVFMLTSFDEDVYTHELFSAFQIFNYARYQNNTEEQQDVHKKIVREIEFHKKRVAAWERELMELLEHRGESAEIDARILELDSELETDLDTYSSLSIKTKQDLGGSALLSLVEKLDLFLERNT